MFFFRNIVGMVPPTLMGAGRIVHWGQNQLTGFINMNFGTHAKKHVQFFDHLTRGDEDSADRHRKFYDEYMAVMDLDGQFYLDTIERVFINEDLPNGKMVVHGQAVDPSQITNTALMTIEGKEDDISAPLQCSAAHDLCPNIPAEMQCNHLQEGVGHYGIFHGSKWAAEICPRITAFIRDTGKQHGLTYRPAVGETITSKTWKQAENEDYRHLPPSPANDRSPKVRQHAPAA
jgi:poly(3-hydroxybutyrate) depolymerase